MDNNPNTAGTEMSSFFFLGGGVYESQTLNPKLETLSPKL